MVSNAKDARSVQVVLWIGLIAGSIAFIWIAHSLPQATRQPLLIALSTAQLGLGGALYLSASSHRYADIFADLRHLLNRLGRELRHIKAILAKSTPIRSGSAPVVANQLAPTVSAAVVNRYDATATTGRTQLRKAATTIAQSDCETQDRLTERSDDTSLYPQLGLRHRMALTVVVALLVQVVAYALTVRDAAPAATSVAGTLATMFYLLILIGLTEEVLFRGIPFEIWRKNGAAALIFSSLAFSIYHINNGVQFLPYYFCFGLVFGILRHHGVSILSLACFHGVYNYLNFELWPVSAYMFGEAQFILMSSLSLLTIVALCGWIASRVLVSDTSTNGTV